MVTSKSSEQDLYFDDILRKLEELKSNFSGFQDKIKTISDVPELSRKKLKRSSRIPTLTMGESNGDKKKETELTCIEAATKECFENLDLESRQKRRDIIDEVSNSFEESRKYIQQEIDIILSCAREKNEGVETNHSFIIDVEKVENNCKETLLFLDRQQSEMGILYQALNNFNRRFLYVAAKFDAYWQKTNASCKSAIMQLNESERLFSSTAMEVDRRSQNLVQQARTFRNTFSAMQCFFKYKQCAFPMTVSLDLHNLLGETDKLREASKLNIVEDYSEKLQYMLLLAENTGQNLQLLTQASDNLEGLHDLVENINKRYDSVMRYLMTLFEKIANNKSPIQSDGRELLTDFIFACKKSDRNSIKLNQKNDNYCQLQNDNHPYAQLADIFDSNKDISSDQKRHELKDML